MIKPVQLRLKIILNPEKSFGERAFAAAELICFPLSFLTFTFVIADFCCKGIGVDLYGCLPCFWMRKGLSVLVAAAIGYVTNWLAIMMLFRPYEKKGWLFIWPQGLIPRNKPKMAREMGRQVGTKLLSPEKLVDELCLKIREYLSRPEVVRTLRLKLQDMLRSQENEIVDFLVPEIERAVVNGLDNNLNAKQVLKLWDEIILPRLNDPDTRNFIAGELLSLISKEAPELVTNIRDELRSHLMRVLGIPLAVDMVMTFFADEKTVATMIANWLGREGTHEMFKAKLLLAGDRVNKWMQSQDGHQKVEKFVEDSLKVKLREWLGHYVRDVLPTMIKDATASQKLWNWVEESLLPNVKDKLTFFIAENKQKILDALRISERVEDAINKQSIREFHEMLDRLAAQHLSAIQVLGYVLGGVVGFLQRCS